MVKVIFTFLFLLSCSMMMSAQDTFYVKKNSPRLVASPPAASWDSTNTDSIVSYTAEYQKPNSNIFVQLHLTGPTLAVPPEVYNGRTRVIFTEIIAVDTNGRKYRQPDCIWLNGVIVPLKTP
jgi:hypothetical protein